MRLSFTVHADNEAELVAALNEITKVMPPFLFKSPARRFEINAWPCDDTMMSLASPVMPPVAAETPVAAPKPRGRPRATPAPVPELDAETDTADADTDPVLFDPEPETETAPAGMTGAEAKLAALGKLRTVFALTAAAAAAVKALQKQFGVAKFIEVPDAKGAELNAEADKLWAAHHAVD